MLNETQSRNAILNGSVKMRQLTEVLTDIKNYLQQYLSDLQRDIISIDKIRINKNDLLIKPDKAFTGIDINTMYVYNVNHSFIHYNNRLSFKKSPYYNKAISYSDIAENKNIFLYSYFILINGYLDLSAKIICKENITQICLNPKYMSEELRSQFNDSCVIDILIIPDVIHIRKEIKKSNLVSNNMKITENKLSSNLLPFVFIHKENSLVKLYNTSVNKKVITIPSNSVNDFDNNDDVIIDLILIPEYLTSFTCNSSTKYFKVSEDLDMPIPLENTLVFDQRSDKSLILSDIELKKNYPEIFELDNHNNTILVYLFYHKSSSDNGLKFDSQTSVYNKIINVLNSYKSNNITEKIKNFNPKVYEYCLKNFHIDYNDRTIESAVYKINKMVSMYKDISKFIRLYYECLSRDTPTLILNPYDEIIRNDNKQEISTKALQMTFDEPRVLLTFPNRDLYRPIPLKFWIDGLRYVPDIRFRDGALEYIYIPKRLLKEDSKLYYEVSNNVSYEYSFKATSSVILDLHLTKDIPMDGIYVLDQNRNLISKNKYKIFVSKDNVELGNAESGTMWVNNQHTLRFVPTDNSIKNKVLIIGYKERPIEFNILINQKNYLLRDLNYKNYINGIKYGRKYVRVYREGRLVPWSAYDVHIPDKFNGHWQIELHGYGSFFNYQVDYIPEGYTEIYHQEEIDPSGIINLIGIINKPFSHKYYDIYVNGFRIHGSQIEKVSDFIIRLKNINSLKKLYIYEKDITLDGLFVLSEEESHNYLNQKLAEETDFMTRFRELIDDIIPAYGITDVDDFDNALDIICNDIIEYIEDNRKVTSVLQVDDYMFDYYRYYFASDDVFLLNPNKDHYDKRSFNFVYFIAPQRHEEMTRINRYFFVDQYSKILDETYGFIDAHEEREDFDDFKYPNANKELHNDTAMINGHHFTDRHDSTVQFVGQ